MNILKKKIIFSLLISVLLFLSCATPYGDGQLKYKGRSNYLIPLASPFLPRRASSVFDHTVNKTYRVKSDCQPFCPKVDVWQYQYKPKSGNLIIDKKPISSRKPFWKNKNEARILALSLFGENPIYMNGLLEFIESFQYIKAANNIKDPIWGYETFTVRVYTPKRNPKNLQRLGKLKGEVPPEFINKLLEIGCEIVFVDNEMDQAKLDATFWRFLVAAEDMPAGQKIRYILRDADSRLTAAEAYAVGEWIDKGFKFHRMNLHGVCMGPVTADKWGGTHVGSEILFKDLPIYLSTFPYRLEYGDDELFLRDIVWPRMKYSSSILTHYAIGGWKSTFGNPYVGSCEQPTQKYCDTIKPGGICEDILLPYDIVYPVLALAFRSPLSELKKYPEYFDMHLNTERGERVRRALSADFK